MKEEALIQKFAADFYKNITDSMKQFWITLKKGRLEEHVRGTMPPAAGFKP